MNTFMVRAYGSALYTCCVCGQARARVALRMDNGREIGLCSTKACLLHEERDRRFISAARSFTPEVSCAWAGVVAAVASFDPPPDPRAPVVPMRTVYMGPRRPIDPRAPRTYSFARDDGLDDC
jgi:hypothetical protein